MSASRPSKTVRGDAMRAILLDEIAKHHGGLHDALARFDAISAVDAWMQTIRAVEEFINVLLFGLDETLGAAFAALPVDAPISRPRHFRAVRHEVAYRYGEEFARRFTTLVVQAAAIGQSFRQHGLVSAGAGLATIGTMAGYLQSRRRHLVTLLYTLPTACRGQERVVPLDTLNVFLPLVELNGISLTGLYQQLMLAEAFKDHKMLLGEDGSLSARDFPALDAFFLEPERASVVEIHAATPDRTARAAFEPVRSDRLFSAAELRHDIRLLEAAYDEFDLANSDFAPAAHFARRLSELAEDDFGISLTKERFADLADELALSPLLRRALVHSGDDYVANSNSYAPFIALGEELRTTVTLLSRFLYHWKNVCLYRNRRFQIRSGFIFESSVADALARQGFEVTGIKRLNRKEFDVVATRDGVIFNFQCKNNLVDLSRLEADVRLFARYNRARAASYERALKKEAAREGLLKAKLGLDRVEHLVLSRFPVASENPRVVSFSRIESVDALASSLVDADGP